MIEYSTPADLNSLAAVPLAPTQNLYNLAERLAPEAELPRGFSYSLINLIPHNSAYPCAFSKV